jgi:hypothetical protein
MELFAIKIDGHDHCQVVDNESMCIIGYLEQGEKGLLYSSQRQRTIVGNNQRAFFRKKSSVLRKEER